MIAVIARHEASSLLRTPQIWGLAALLATMFGFLFLKQIEQFVAVQDSLAMQDHPPGLTGFLAVRYLAPLAIVFSLLGPLFAMRSFSDEYRHNTLSLWQSSPVSNTSLVIGKYLGVLTATLLILMLAVILPMALVVLAPMDFGVLLSCTLGLFLCTAACASIGLYCSALTEHALLAIVASLTTLLLLWFLGNVSATESWLQALQVLSPARHLNSFFQGLINSLDIAYFVLFTVLFLGLTIVRVDALRFARR